jgi:hypothetical protein
VIRLQLVSFELLLLGGGDHRANAGIPDQVPADEVGVSAVVRIAEGPLMRVVQHHGEEGGRAAGESSCRARFDVDERRILIARRQRRERVAA